MAARRRTAEDKNIKLLRELAASPANKQCFDCLQRGPTYINVTIGSYVCTTCSGILRGLTPPHRVKSISMTTFSPDEIDHLKSRGNEYCKYVWLGTYDTTTNSLESEVSDDQRKRDFMMQKYEKKRWYVDPDIAVKRMQSDQLLRQKQQIAQPQQNSISRNSNLPETLPLSRLLGKSPTPLVVQNHQSAEAWPHPVSSASAHAISTKTTSQNQGSRSIDLLSELTANSANAAAKAQASSNSTANGNFANFANFESAFSSGEKTAGSVSAPPVNLPMSASLDAYPPPPSRQSQTDPVVPAFSPPPTVSKASTTTVPATKQNNIADRYAALADLDSLFHQPTTVKAPSWTLDTTSSASLFDVPASSERTSSYSTAPSNPFTSSDMWNQPQQNTQTSFQPVNPFQATTESTLVYSQPTSSQGYVPFFTPMVGNSPSEENMRNQFNANFTSQAVTSPTNGYSSSQLMMQNGGFTSPIPSTMSWGVPANVPQWSSSQLAQGGLFSNDNKTTTETAQHADWIQNPVNPFMVLQSNNMGFPVAPRSSSSNPFL